MILSGSVKVCESHTMSSVCPGVVAASLLVAVAVVDVVVPSAIPPETCYARLRSVQGSVLQIIGEEARLVNGKHSWRAKTKPCTWWSSKLLVIATGNSGLGWRHSLMTAR
ncbi:hypothetical protein V1477_002875 [Vespula maculifrons]|uniref:Secreted protein n=1 Tax=Vespula maculifrons TaxID=7453 RepID=A0ABD2CW18_VESMC